MVDLSYLFRRQHENVRKNRTVWQRSFAAYSGGEEYINSALIQHVSEIDLEFLERRKRAYYLNYPRKIARLITQYAFSKEPQRLGADPDMVEDFSRTGYRTNETMRQFSTMINIFGSAWLLVEMPRWNGELDIETKRNEKIRPFARVLSPLEVVDFAYGDDGALNWALTEEDKLVDNGPFAPPVRKLRRTLWTKTLWRTFERDIENGQIKEVASGHNLIDRVPIIHGCEVDGVGLTANHWFEDAVRISDAILNNESESQMNTVKQMFGLLVIAENFARSGRNIEKKGTSGQSGNKFSHVLARSAAIWETTEEKGISRYITPSGAENNAIREANSALKRELFDVIGMTVTNDKNVAETAESKAWDHQSVKQFLSSRVDILEQTEIEAWKLMNALDPSIPVPEVLYNREFDVNDLRDSVESLLKLDTISGNADYQKAISLAALNLLERFEKIAPERKKMIVESIEKEELMPSTYQQVM